MSDRKEQISFLEKVLQTDSKAGEEVYVDVDRDDIQNAQNHKMKRADEFQHNRIQNERIGLTYLAGDNDDELYQEIRK